MADSHTRSKKYTTVMASVIALLHLVGIWGLHIMILRPIFLQLVPLHLVIMLSIIVASHRGTKAKLTFLILSLFIAGFIIESIGTHTGWLFGNYTYGKTLGPGIGGVPVIIGINWFLLIYSAGTLLQRTSLNNKSLRILTGAIILVMLDILMEPAAIRFGYWHWNAGAVPLYNYVCWFLVSAAMLYLFEKLHFRKQSMVAPTFLIVQFGFFMALFIF